MRYAVALVISLLLIITAVIFVWYVERIAAIGKDLGVAMPASTLAAFEVARLLHRWWYIFLILFIAIPQAVAAFFSTRNKE
jgi:hypothetical protein